MGTTSTWCVLVDVADELMRCCSGKVVGVRGGSGRFGGKRKGVSKGTGEKNPKGGAGVHPCEMELVRSRILLRTCSTLHSPYFVGGLAGGGLRLGVEVSGGDRSARLRHM